MISVPLVRYVLMAALRDRLILSLILLIAVGTCLSVFTASAAVIEKSQFTIVFAASGLRMAGVVGLVLFAVFHIRRSFDNRDVDFLLSRPISRSGFILSHAIAFSLLALLLAAVTGLVILLLTFRGAGAGDALWVLGLTMEFIIVVNAALFFAMVISSASGAALAVFGLYILSRLMGQLLGDAAANYGNPAVNSVLKIIMDIVAMVTPRLDLMTQTTWLVYPDIPQNVSVAFILAQGVIYTSLLLAATLVDLRRRQF